MKKNNVKGVWNTPARLNVVSEEIQKSPGNLTAAFEQIAKRIGISTHAVNYAWYTNLKKNHPEFATGSKQSVIVNQKNVVRKEKGVLVHEATSTQTFDGMRVVTVKRYYTN